MDLNRVFESFEDLQPHADTVVCLGNFDGLHLGHQEILRRCLSEARKRELKSILFTFYPHPRRVLDPLAEMPRQIFNRMEKREMLSKSGFDFILEQKFDRDFSNLTHEEFSNEILAKKLKARLVVIGRDFHFGYQAKGSSKTLEESPHFECTEVRNVELGNDSVSSGRIRELIEAGHLLEANQLLDHMYFLTGQVRPGHQRGRELGFRTANLKLDKECLPAKGVYFCLTQIEGEEFLKPSLMNIGERPTFEEAGVEVEVHILDFKKELYGDFLRVFVLHRLRDEKKFSSKEQLIDQINKDVEQSRRYVTDPQSLQGLADTLKKFNAPSLDAMQSEKVFDFIREL